MWFGRVAILFGLLFGLVGTQAPEFAQQYRQRLGGAVDELQRVLANFDRAAASQGLDRQSGIARFENNSDPFVKGQGAEVQRLQARETRLATQLQDMDRSGPVVRLLVLARDFDPGIAKSAIGNFTPAVPVTLESAASGLVGFLLGLGLTHALAWPVRRRRRRRLRDRANALSA